MAATEHSGHWWHLEISQRVEGGHGWWKYIMKQTCMMYVFIYTWLPSSHLARLFVFHARFELKFSLSCLLNGLFVGGCRKPVLGWRHVLLKKTPLDTTAQNWTIESLVQCFWLSLDSPYVEVRFQQFFPCFPGTLPGRTHDKGRVTLVTENCGANQILVLFVFQFASLFRSEMHMVSNPTDDTWSWCVKCGFRFLRIWYMFDYILYIHTHDKVHLSYHWQVCFFFQMMLPLGASNRRPSQHVPCQLMK